MGEEINRENRRPFQGEEEYAKYMKSIRQRYQKYVKNILGHNTWRKNRTLSSATIEENLVDGQIDKPPTEFASNTAQQQLAATPTKYPFNYRPTKKKIQSKKVSLNGIKSNRTIAAQGQADSFYSRNTYLGHDNQRFKEAVSTRKTKKVPSEVDLMAQLNAQIVRKKRNTEEAVTDLRDERIGKQGGGRKNGRRNLNVTTVATVPTTGGANDDIEAGETADGQKRGKPKSPCDVSVARFKLNIMIRIFSFARQFQPNRICDWMWCARDGILRLRTVPAL